MLRNALNNLHIHCLRHRSQFYSTDTRNNLLPPIAIVEQIIRQDTPAAYSEMIATSQGRGIHPPQEDVSAFGGLNFYPPWEPRPPPADSEKQPFFRRLS